MTDAWLHSRLADIERLATELPGTELQSMLLEVLRRRARARTPRDVLAQYERDAFCALGLVDQRVSTAIDAHLLAACAEFEALELSPLAPLGTCSSVALTDQNRVVSALRGTEVVSDPTNVLALECARRLRAAPGRAVHLATSHRVVRAQPVPKRPSHSQHFRLFALASGGREAKDHAFTMEAVLLHIRSMLGALDRLEQHGYAFGARRVTLLTTAERRRVADRVAPQLPCDVSCEPLEHAYYSGLRYQIWLTPSTGAPPMPAIDGGCFDWLTKIAHNGRLVYVASGAGSQLIPLLFDSNAAQRGTNAS